MTLPNAIRVIARLSLGLAANDYSTITLVGWYVKRKRNPTEKVPDTFSRGITTGGNRGLRGYEEGWFGGFAG